MAKEENSRRIEEYNNKIKINGEAWRKAKNEKGELEELKRTTKENMMEAGKKGEIDVLVIGGGATGVAAMTTLNAGKKKAWMIEATTQLGGAVRTIGITKEGEEEKRVEIGREKRIGEAQRAVMTVAKDIYKQLGETAEKYEDTTKRPNANKNIVDSLKRKTYTYERVEIPKEKRSAKIAPIAGLPTPLPRQWNKIRDVLPFDSAKNLIKLVLGIMNIQTDLFYEKEKNPKKKYEHTIVPYLKNLDELTVKEWLETQKYMSEQTRNMMKLVVQSIVGGNIKTMSMLSFVEYAKGSGSLTYMMQEREFGPTQYYLKDTLQTLINTMANDKVNEGRIVLEAKAVEIKKEGDNMKVILEDGTEIEAKKVIVAVAPGKAMKHIKLHNVGTAYKKFLKDRIVQETKEATFIYEKPFWRDEYNGLARQVGRNKKQKRKENPSIIKVVDDTQKGIAMLTATVQKGEDIKEACLDYFYQVYGRDPCSDEDKELVEGNNLIGYVEHTYTKNGLCSAGVELLKTKAQTTHEQFLYQNQGVCEEGNPLPIYFAGAAISNMIFPGTVSGSLTKGAGAALALFDEEQKTPFASLATTNAFYQQFEPTQMMNGNMESFEIGFLDFTPPQIINFSTVSKFTTALNELSEGEVYNFNELSHFDTVQQLNQAIGGVPNPGLYQKEYQALSFLERGRMMTEYSDYGNIVAFFQMMNEDVVLDSNGPASLKKYIPYIGSWKGINPFDPNSLVGFFIGTTCINAWDLPRKIYQNIEEPNILQFVGPSMMVPPGFEADKPRGQEGVDYNKVETSITYTFSKKTGYVEHVNIYSDLMSVYQLLKNNGYIPNDA